MSEDILHNYIIYKHTFPNGKVYIGKTNQKPERRWGLEGHRYSEQSLIWNAIQKYGWENVVHEVLLTELTAQEARNKEIEYIAKFHSYYLDPLGPGYNMTRGGEGSLQNDPIKIQELYNQGLTTYQIAAQLCCDRGSVANILKGLGYDLSKANKKAVNQFDLEGNFIASFESAVKAGEELNIDYKLINGTCRGVTKSAKGFQWHYYNEEEIKNGIGPVQRASGGAKKKKIDQYDLEGKFIKTFNSLAEAAAETGATRANIRSAAQGKIKTSMGYKWKYHED